MFIFFFFFFFLFKINTVCTDWPNTVSWWYFVLFCFVFSKCKALELARKYYHALEMQCLEQHMLWTNNVTTVIAITCAPWSGAHIVWGIKESIDTSIPGFKNLWCWVCSSLHKPDVRWLLFADETALPLRNRPTVVLYFVPLFWEQKLQSLLIIPF